MAAYSKARQADEAFFEDWSEWASLDDLPELPRINGQRMRRHRVPLGSQHHRYYCRLSLGMAGAPHFELSLPPAATILSIVEAIPGARMHPRATGESRDAAWSGLASTRYIPAENWYHLRAALPAIKQAVCAWVRR
ncbi:hypothetical protein [Chelativorans xinjiangense]|uniref:hypothetical protein n=1 Tax=Chelativorans xinjiangense TaxID=2681485 RepID=UPI0013590919|nr:hypothetical protein [Chelativorans xinjiangense]